MHQNSWLRNAARYLNRALVTGVAVFGLFAVGSFAARQSHAATALSYDSNRQVGSNDLIRNRHRLYLPHASAAVAMDARTGQIVYQKNENQHRLVASTGKLMDLYLVGRKINQTPHAWQQPVKINRGLRRMSFDSGDGGYHFNRGHTYTVGNLMKASIIASSNNAAIALGQWAGKSNWNQLKRENRQARLWHLHAHFISLSGLENEDLKPWGYGFRNKRNLAGNSISAKDLAVISYHILKDYPQFLKYSKVGHMYEDGQYLYNYNEFLPHHTFHYLAHGLHVDGLKTGWTPAAGYCFVGTAKMPHRDRIITVVLNDNYQWLESDRLMRYVYKYSPLLRRHRKPVKKVTKVNKSVKKNVKANVKATQKNRSNKSSKVVKHHNKKAKSVKKHGKSLKRARAKKSRAKRGMKKNKK